jgi:hypothetical protein
LFSDYILKDFSALITGAAVFSTIFLFIELIIYAKNNNNNFSNLTNLGRNWVYKLIAVIIICLINGLFINQNYYNAVLVDLSVYIMLICFVALGSFPNFWQDIDRTLFILFIVGLLLNIIGFHNVTSLVNLHNPKFRLTREIFSYSIQNNMAMWPYFLLTARRRSKFAQIIISIGVGFIIFQQIVFQKRLPIVLVMLYIFIFLFVLPRFKERWQSASQTSKKKAKSSLSLAGVAIIILLILFPVTVTNSEFIGNQFQGLLDRFGGVRGEGVYDLVITSNNRFLESQKAFSTFDYLDFALGRGFGGYWVTSSFDDVIEGEVLRETGTFGDRQLHVGGLMPLLKGGVILMLVYYYGVFLALRGWRGNIRNPMRAVAFFLVTINLIQSIFGGSFILTNPFAFCIASASLGLCLSKTAPTIQTSAVNSFIPMR